jgi:hypothetical protein
MNKHYTPKIEEFKVGFKYEFASSVIIDGVSQPDEWTSAIIESNDDIELINSNARVKYLDKQDVENLGFRLEFENKNYIELFKADEVQISFSTESQLTRIIKFWKFNLEVDGETQYNSEVVFSGTIKNLSELKMILDMLNIAYRNMR